VAAFFWGCRRLNARSSEPHDGLLRVDGPT